MAEGRKKRARGSNMGLDSDTDRVKYIVGVHSRAEITAKEVETSLAYLRDKKDSGMFCETKFAEGRLVSLFVADSLALLDYACFGDAVAIFRMNSYNMPFVVLAGLNHHHQTCVFGCALLHDENVEAYSWLFRTFLCAMQGCMPISVVTDGHKAMCEAIEHVLPRSRQRLCAWHLENHADSVVDDPSFISDFKVCMLEVLSLDDFELKWKAMVDKYKVSENPWIRRMYEERHLWAEAYFRGHFHAGLKSTRRVCESFHEHLSRFSLHKLKLNQFIYKYDWAVNIIRWKDGKPDYDDTCVHSALSTPLVKFEKHAADVFSLESYKRFLSELRLETCLFVLNKDDGPKIRKYKLGNSEQQNSVYEVMFKPSGPSIKCSCLKFETIGFPCSHAIHIIKCERLEKIPQDLIHPRWTKSARSTAQFWQRYLPPVSDDVLARMMRLGYMASRFSVLIYLASQSEQAFNHVNSALDRLIHEMEEPSSAPHASNSRALSMPTNEKDSTSVSRFRGAKDSQLGNRGKRRKIQSDGHSRNVEQINHGCPKLINSPISMADKTPIDMQDTLDNSSDGAKDHDTDPHVSQ